MPEIQLHRCTVGGEHVAKRAPDAATTTTATVERCVHDGGK
jgi:hypothetical protein